MPLMIIPSVSKQLIKHSMIERDMIPIEQGSRLWSQCRSTSKAHFILQGVQSIISQRPSCHSRIRSQARDVINCPVSKGPYKQSCPVSANSFTDLSGDRQQFLAAKEQQNTIPKQ